MATRPRANHDHQAEGHGQLAHLPPTFPCADPPGGQAGLTAAWGRDRQGQGRSFTGRLVTVRRCMRQRCVGPDTRPIQPGGRRAKSLTTREEKANLSRKLTNQAATGAGPRPASSSHSSRSPRRPQAGTALACAGHRLRTALLTKACGFGGRSGGPPTAPVARRPGGSPGPRCPGRRTRPSRAATAPHRRQRRGPWCQRSSPALRQRKLPGPVVAMERGCGGGVRRVVVGFLARIPCWRSVRRPSRTTYLHQPSDDCSHCFPLLMCSAV